jgi:hypothetical protein
MFNRQRGFRDTRRTGLYENPSLGSPANTFIGGEALRLPDKQSLATLINLPVSEITYFKIVGNDIEAFIASDYSLPPDALKNYDNLTYYDDPSGKCKALGLQESGYFGFTCQNLIYLNFPGATGLFTHTQWSMNGGFSKLQYINYGNVTNFGGTTGKNYAFINISSEATLIVNSTAIADPDVTDVVSKSNWRILTYSGTPSIIGPVTDLTANGSLYFNSLKLEFTPPSSTLNIVGYFVHINGIFYDHIKPDNTYITGLTANTQYNIQIQAIDSDFNRSELSNILNVTTGINSYSETTYIAEYKLLLDEAIANNIQIPAATQREKDNQIILNLKAEEIWNLLDVFYYFQTEYPPLKGEQNFYSYNWKSLNYKLYTPPGYSECNFIPGKGFTAKYATTATAFRNNWRATVDAVNFLVLDGSMFFKHGPLNPTSSTYNIAGARVSNDGNQIYLQKASGSYLARFYGIDGAATVANTDSHKHIHICDKDATKKTYVDGVLKATSTNKTDGGLQPNEMYINSIGNGGGSYANTIQGIPLHYIGWGASLENKTLQLHQILNGLY